MNAGIFEDTQKVEMSTKTAVGKFNLNTNLQNSHKFFWR